MNEAWRKVKAFHQAYSVPVSDQPGKLSEERVAKRKKWMEEELDEFAKASTIEDQADAMIDTIYLALGTLVEMGVKPEAVFQIVHEANMSKLWPDGKPRYRETDGKVIKPPGWKIPSRGSGKKSGSKKWKPPAIHPMNLRVSKKIKCRYQTPSLS